RVVEQFAAVQIVERGSPWFADAKPDTICESYGLANTRTCRFTPLGPVPDRPPPPKKPFDFACPPGAPEPPRGARGPATSAANEFWARVGEDTSAVIGRDYELGGSVPRRPEDSVLVLGQHLRPDSAVEEASFVRKSCAVSVAVNLVAHANVVGKL